MTRAAAVYRALLHAYPAPFRDEYGDEMLLTFVEQLEASRRDGDWLTAAAVWCQAARDLCTIAPAEHWQLIRQDLRDACRMAAAAPAMAATVTMLLALGLGTATAIFALWTTVLHAPLPAVHDPTGLVMLTKPTARGLIRGSWDSRSDGPRAWLSYREFEDLGTHASGFASLMAAQSDLTTWQLRVGHGAPEEARGRLVSGAFFEVLGVRPAIGRLFTAADDAAEPLQAVVSYAYWQRRFGARPTVVDETLTVHDTTLTIVGVAPPGFIGESNGQQPDVWLPLRLQPRLIPGHDWLREQPPDKVMWLHAFGRLRPGVTIGQAEAEVNGVLQANLEAFYGQMSGERRRELMEQRLHLSPGARGASGTLAQFSSSLTLLLTAVAILLLIACVNLANLLLARGEARRTEIAVRVSLGASRRRLVRQLVTENAALTVLGGLGAVAVAALLHGVLVRMLREADARFFLPFELSAALVTFLAGATLAAACVIGVLPAWQMTTVDTGAPRLDSGTRGTVGSRREGRHGRWLVSLQLALSLPLLVGAGLLVRTVYNLQHPVLGFRAERLLLADVNLGGIVRDTDRRDRTLRDLRERLERLPGVEAVSFSQLGVFTGDFSTATIEVEGSDQTRVRGRSSALDRVGARYFETLGVPIRAGRDVAEPDRRDGPRVCLVNEAFVRRFFDDRNPIGLRVTTVDEGVRTSYEVVGVSGDARMHGLRGEIEPRFFVPAEQRLSQSSSRTFLIRARSGLDTLAPAIRETVQAVDASMVIASLEAIDDRAAREAAEERALMRLASVFGLAALALAAIGLYGVLSYGVTRRSGEIAIRIALGAQSRGVVRLILGESAALVIAGLVAGAALSYAAARLVASRLYGVAPQDPLTLTLAVALLLLVALAASYLPARRASKLDPIAVLHQG